MSGKWKGSTRGDYLPKNWKALRLKVLRRDNYQCQRCLTTKSLGARLEVDHVKRGDDHSLTNLQTLCTKCHTLKTQSEVRELRTQRKRVEQHPGVRKN